MTCDNDKNSTDWVKVLKKAAKQFKQALHEGVVTCECGRTIPLRFLYKCLYCDLYFCQRCAGHHFGESRKDYQKRLGINLGFKDPG